MLGRVEMNTRYFSHGWRDFWTAACKLKKKVSLRMIHSLSSSPIVETTSPRCSISTTDPGRISRLKPNPDGNLISSLRLRFRYVSDDVGRLSILLEQIRQAQDSLSSRPWQLFTLHGRNPSTGGMASIGSRYGAM